MRTFLVGSVHSTVLLALTSVLAAAVVLMPTGVGATSYRVALAPNTDDGAAPAIDQQRAFEAGMRFALWAGSEASYNITAVQLPTNLSSSTALFAAPDVVAVASLTHRGDAVSLAAAATGAQLASFTRSLGLPAGGAVSAPPRAHVPVETAPATLVGALINVVRSNAGVNTVPCLYDSNQARLAGALLGVCSQSFAVTDTAAFATTMVNSDLRSRVALTLCSAACVASAAAAVAALEQRGRVRTFVLDTRFTNVDLVASAMSSQPAAVTSIMQIVHLSTLPPPGVPTPSQFVEPVDHGAHDGDDASSDMDHRRQHAHAETSVTSTVNNATMMQHDFHMAVTMQRSSPTVVAAYVMGAAIATSLASLPPSVRADRALRFAALTNATSLVIVPDGSALLPSMGGECRDAPGRWYAWVLQPSAMPMHLQWAALVRRGSADVTSAVLRSTPCASAAQAAATVALTSAALTVGRISVNNPVAAALTAKIEASLAFDGLQLRQELISAVSGVGVKLREFARTARNIPIIVGQQVDPVVGRADLTFTKSAVIGAFSTMPLPEDVRTAPWMFPVFPDYEWQVAAIAKSCAAAADHHHHSSTFEVNVVCTEATCPSVDAAFTARFVAYGGSSHQVRVLPRLSLQLQLSWADVFPVGNTTSNMPATKRLFVLLVGDEYVPLMTFIGTWLPQLQSGQSDSEVFVLQAHYPYVEQMTPTMFANRVHVPISPSIGETFDENLHEFGSFVTTVLSFWIGAAGIMSPDEILRAFGNILVVFHGYDRTYTFGTFGGTSDCRNVGPHVEVNHTSLELSGCRLPPLASTDDADDDGLPLYAIILVAILAVIVVCAIVAGVVLVVQHVQNSARRSKSAGSDDDERDEDLDEDLEGDLTRDDDDDDVDEGELTEKSDEGGRHHRKGRRGSANSAGSDARSSSSSKRDLRRHNSSNSKISGAGTGQSSGSASASASSAARTKNSSSKGSSNIHTLRVSRNRSSGALGLLANTTDASDAGEVDERNTKIFAELTREVTVDNDTTCGVNSQRAVLGTVAFACALLTVLAIASSASYVAVVGTNFDMVRRARVAAQVVDCPRYLVERLLPRLPRDFHPDVSLSQRNLVVNHVSQNRVNSRTCEDALYAVESTMPELADELFAAIATLPTAYALNSPVPSASEVDAMLRLVGLARAVAQTAGGGAATANAIVSTRTYELVFVIAWSGALTYPSGVGPGFNIVSSFDLLLQYAAHLPPSDQRTSILQRLQRVRDRLTTDSDARRAELARDLRIDSVNTLANARELLASLEVRVAEIEDSQFNAELWLGVAVVVVVLVCICSIVFLAVSQVMARRGVNAAIANTETDRRVGARHVPAVQLAQLGMESIHGANAELCVQRKMACMVFSFRNNAATTFEGVTDEFEFMYDMMETVGRSADNVGSCLDFLICGDVAQMIFDNTDDATRVALELLVTVKKEGIRNKARGNSVMRAALIDDGEGSSADQFGAPGLRITTDAEQDGGALHDILNGGEDNDASAGGSSKKHSVGRIPDENDLRVAIALHYGSATSGTIVARQQMTLARAGCVVNDARALLRYAKRCEASFFLSGDARDALQTVILETRPFGSLPEAYGAQAPHGLDVHDVFQTESVETKNERRSSRRMLERYLKSADGNRRYLREAIRTANGANVADYPLIALYQEIVAGTADVAETPRTATTPTSGMWNEASAVSFEASTQQQGLSSLFHLSPHNGSYTPRARRSVRSAVEAVLANSDTQQLASIVEQEAGMTSHLGFSGMRSAVTLDTGAASGQRDDAAPAANEDLPGMVVAVAGADEDDDVAGHDHSPPSLAVDASTPPPTPGLPPSTAAQPAQPLDESDRSHALRVPGADDDDDGTHSSVSTAIPPSRAISSVSTAMSSTSKKEKREKKEKKEKKKDKKEKRRKTITAEMEGSASASHPKTPTTDPGDERDDAA